MEQVEITPILCFAGSQPSGDTQGVNGVVLCHATELNSVILACKDNPLPKKTMDIIRNALAAHYPACEATDA
jgi:hypothetical protein